MSDSTNMETELITIEEGKALELFSKEGGLDFILDDAKALVDGFVHDITTDAGRKRTASLAFKVAKFKVRLDGMGKGLVAGWKAKARLVDATRKHARDELDALKAIARKPLTDWEGAQAARVARFVEALEILRNLVGLAGDTSVVYAANLNKARATPTGKQWEEYESEAARTKDEVVTYLEGALKKAQESEAEKAELERLRKEEEGRKQEERDEAIRKESADKARAEEQYKTKMEKERVAAEAQRKLDDQRKKEENKSHRTEVHEAAISSIVALGIGSDDAQKIVEAIAAGQVKNVSMNY